jgi:ureidoacrylate peracid hydrolase
MWLQSFGINVLIFCGVDTSICVETSIREAFNIGYDIILISDATASGIKSHYETTLDRVRDYYGLQMSYDRFAFMINNLNLMKKQHFDKKELSERTDKFIKEFGLLDFRTFREAPVQSA